MGHALIASYGGIPLLYMGDELALLNDYTYTDVPEHAHDSRWIHRPVMDWERAARLPDGGRTPEGRVFAGIRHVLARRAAVPGFHGAVATEVLNTGQPELFAFARRAPMGSVICVFNFTENWSGLPVSWFQAQGATRMFDMLSDAPVIGANGSVGLPPYARVWVV
jgi:amylosucrase